MSLQTTFLIDVIALVIMVLALLGLVLLHSSRSLRQAKAAARALPDALRAANLVTSADLAPLSSHFDQLHADVAALAGSIQSRMQAPSASNDPVTLERQILAESWRQFRKSADRAAALDKALQDREWTQLLDQLTSVVPASLKPSFDAAIDPCREQRSILQRIELIPQIADGTFVRLPNDAEEIRRARELATLLGSAIDRVTEFRFESWVTDSFLPFADLYLLRYQQTSIDQRGGELGDGLLLVRQVLQTAGLEPIDVTPGETLFDGNRHVGRSTSNDPRFADGVITGVIRNGFVDGGRQVVRQPEVIVNRMR
jgi:hypothetical protein